MFRSAEPEGYSEWYNGWARRDYNYLLNVITTSNLRSIVRFSFVPKCFEMTNEAGNTLLHLAAKSNNPEMIECLLEKGASISLGIVNSEGKTPIQCLNSPENLSEYSELFKTINEFAKYPTDSKDTHRYGYILLCLVKKVSQYPILKNDADATAIALIKAGAKNNWANNQGLNVLHVAIDVGNLTVFKSLLRSGADPDLSCRDIPSAFEYARNDKKEDFVQAIKAEKNARQKAKETLELKKQLTSCQQELTRYPKKHVFPRHEDRANSLRDALKLLKPSDQDEKWKDAFKSAIDKANKAFTGDKTIAVSPSTPHYARPPKNHKEDEYNEIIKKYKTKLDSLLAPLNIVENTVIQPSSKQPFVSEKKESTSRQTATLVKTSVPEKEEPTISSRSQLITPITIELTDFKVSGSSPGFFNSSTNKLESYVETQNTTPRSPSQSR